MSRSMQNQMSLLQNSGDPVEPSWFRPIHYIGSKLRILQPILAIIDSVSNPGETACDLFSGSGTVSMALASNRRVVAIDIQEYSRTLCSAVLTKRDVSDREIANFLNNTARAAAN